MTTRLADKDTELLEKRLRKSPESRLFSRLADIYRKEGNLSRAIELCLDGIQKHPDYVTGHIILGRCYFEQQNYNDAFDEFKKVCTIDRHNQIALKMLADIFVLQNMNQKAGCIYEFLYKSDPYNKSLAKLASQYPSDGTDLFDVLGIDISTEPHLWEQSPAEQQVPDEQAAYSEMNPDIFVDEDSAAQQSYEENQPFPPDVPFDNEKTVAIDGDTLNQQLDMLYQENHQSQENSFDTFSQENPENEEIQSPESSITPEALLDEEAEITGQDISSRIDELFSEKTDSFNNSTFKDMPQIISEEDSPVDSQLVLEKTVALDPSTIITDSNEQSSIEPELSLDQQPDLNIEQPGPFENFDSFSGESIISEFEETMQFERSFLDNVIDTNETVENNELSEKTDALVNREPDAESSAGQEFSATSSTEDPFDPSQLLIDENDKDNEVSQLNSSVPINSDEPQSSDSIFSQTQDADQSLIIDSDEIILENDSYTNLNLPEIELINDEQPSSLELTSDSSIGQTGETNLHQKTGELTDNYQDTLLSEDFSDQPQSASDNSFPEKIDDSLLLDSQDEIMDQVFPESGSELIEEQNEQHQIPELVEEPDDSFQSTLDQDIISEAEITDSDSSADSQAIGIAPDLPILDEKQDSAPDEFLSLTDDNEGGILIGSEETDSPLDSGNDFSAEQDEQTVTASAPVNEITESDDMISIVPDETDNEQNDLISIDADSDLEQLSVEHDDDVLTDMDVLVSDEVLKSVSGDDIVEKMDLIFSENKSSAEVKPVENLPATEDTDSPSPVLSIEDTSDKPDQDLSIISDPESLVQIENYTPPQQDVSNDDVSIDIISDGSESVSQISESEQEIGSIISGQDVIDRLEEFFPGKDLLNTDSEPQTSDDNESEDLLTDFYNIFGDNAVNSSNVDGLDKLDQLEMNIPEQSDKPLSFYDEWNDVCSLQDQNENETFKEKVQKSVEKHFTENISVDQSVTEQTDDNYRPYSIPDHVLTPTLADIYYQQGQHDLAIQIYKRLLSRDPDNENLQQKLNQLLDSSADIAGNNPPPVTRTTKKTTSANSPAKKRKNLVDNRPLAGVRLKKRKNGNINRPKTK